AAQASRLWHRHQDDQLLGSPELQIPAGWRNTDLTGYTASVTVEVTVEWQLDDTPVFDDGSELGRFGLKDGRAAGHLDRFGDIADLQHEVNLIDLAYLQFDAFTTLFGDT